MLGGGYLGSGYLGDSGFTGEPLGDLVATSTRIEGLPNSTVIDGLPNTTVKT